MKIMAIKKGFKNRRIIGAEEADKEGKCSGA
jgi:hypothetical protein